MFGRAFSLIVGFYAGVYMDQNFDVPKVDDPKKIYQRIEKYLENHRKDK